MRATLDRTDLLRALSRVRGALRVSETPILGTALLAVAAGRLALTCTDLSLQVSDSVEATDALDGAAAVPAEMLYAVVRRLPDMARVLVEGAPDGTSVAVRAGRSRFKIPALPAEDFPAFPVQPGGSVVFTVPGADLARMVDGALFAAAKDDFRRYLCGLHLAPVGTLLRATGTDGRRLAQVDAALPVGAKAAPPVTLPHGACAAVLGAVRATGGDAAVTLSTTLASFVVGTATISTKLIDGEYPDTSRVIPLANDKRFEVGRAALLGMVDRVQAVARDHCVRLALGDGRLSLSVTDEKTGAEAEEDAEVDYDGDEVAVGLNSRLLAEVVEHVAGELVRVAIDDDRTPVLIEGAEDGGSLFVLMPMRIT
jgi:DNA polymerase-3 subunit beta